MNRARSLLTGKLVNAKNTNKNRAKYHKVVCPECFEPVALVKKNAKQYFAHCPFKETSPYCLWRIIRDSGKPVATPKPPPLVRPILKPGVFQKALRIAFGVASLRPLPSPYQPSAKKLVKLMQSVWSKRKQCVNISDSISPSDEYLRKWTCAGRQIRIYEAERARNFPYLASKFKLPKNPKKAAPIRKRRVSIVLLLWSQLHKVEYTNELDYLLQLAYHMYKGNMPKITRKTKNPQNTQK